jgi:serine/threonine protein kinase
MKPLAQNTLLQNRYLIVNLIGKGGMGEVYLAIDQRLGSAVALKRTFYAGDAQLAAAFEREARILARLRHPVLPKVSDHFVENENQFLVMEHIAGDDLARRLSATQKPFPLSWVLFWADQLLDALIYLHSHEPPIIHRDIKPQNLKLTNENNIILLDFGLSKNSVGQISSSQSTGSVVGYTPRYAPMEQIRGTGTNPRSDIFSLSATLYQLLTNTVPPDALSRADAVLNGLSDPIVPISTLNPEVPKIVSDVIMKGLAISQEQRFQNAREMQKALREAYSKMQSDMAAKTAIMVSSDEYAETVTDKTEQFTTASNEYQSGLKAKMGAETIPFGVKENTLSEEEKSALSENSQVTAPEDFGATLRYDSKGENFPPFPESEPKQSSIKTEVFLGSDLVSSEPPLVEDSPYENLSDRQASAASDKKEYFVAETATPAAEVEASEQQRQSFDLAKTQAGFVFDQTSSSGNYIGSEATADEKPSSEPQDYQQNQNEFVSTPVLPELTPMPQVEQKKSSKVLVLMVLGGLLSFLVLGGGVAVLGWYFYVYSGNSGNANQATPTPEVSVTPTPEKTPEQVIGNNSIDNTNQENMLTETPTPPPTPSKTPVTTETPPNQISPKTPTPRSTQAPTPRPQKSIPRPTPPPATTRTPRGTVIPQ